MKEVKATQEQSLAQAIKSGKSKAIQARLTKPIEKLHSDIKNEEDQIRLNQAIYDNLKLDFSAKLEQRL